MQDTEDLFAREFQALRIALIREEFRRVRIAAWGLLAVALAVLVFLGFEIHTGATDKGPAWSFVALLGLASIFLAVPLIGKLSLSKDGGAIDLVSPIERIDRLELRAQAARVKSFEQTRQQISGLSQQVEQLAEALEATRSIPTTGREDESSLRDGKKEVSLREIRLRLEAITDQQDQQKGRFGGFESSDGRRLKAEVSKLEFGKDWQNVVFTLVSENGKALEGAYVYSSCTRRSIPTPIG